MLSIMADLLMTATRNQRPKEFHDHLRENADRYIRSPRAEKKYTASQMVNRDRNLW